MAAREMQNETGYTDGKRITSNWVFIVLFDLDDWRVSESNDEGPNTDDVRRREDDSRWMGSSWRAIGTENAPALSHGGAGANTGEPQILRDVLGWVPQSYIAWFGEDFPQERLGAKDLPPFSVGRIKAVQATPWHQRIIKSDWSRCKQSLPPPRYLSPWFDCAYVLKLFFSCLGCIFPALPLVVACVLVCVI